MDQKVVVSPTHLDFGPTLAAQPGLRHPVLEGGVEVRPDALAGAVPVGNVAVAAGAVAAARVPNVQALAAVVAAVVVAAAAVVAVVAAVVAAVALEQPVPG